MLSLEHAQRRALALGRRLESESILVTQGLGRVLASPVCARGPIPRFDASTMDGYAVHAIDVGEGWLSVSGESRAGTPAPALAPGSACRIFTGAPLPAGADAVVMQEQATLSRSPHGEERVRFDAAPAVGAFVRRAGEDLRPGDEALPAGRRVGPREIALLQSLDLVTVDVSRRARVTVMPTGDELRAPGSLEGGVAAASIPESNALALAAMCARAGADPQVLSPTRDDTAAVCRTLDERLGGCELLVTIGGVSVGTHDVVREALAACGVTLDFWRVALKPGKPLAVGHGRGTVVLGLPGNPVSALVTFALFGMPLLDVFHGRALEGPAWQRVPLREAVSRTPSDRLELARGKREAGRVSVLAQQASGSLVGLCAADVLVCIPPNTSHLAPGTEVEVVELDRLGL